MAQLPIPNFLPGLRLIDGTDLNTMLGSADTFLAGILKNANMNTTADQPIPIQLPNPAAGGNGKYTVLNVLCANPSISLTTAAGGIYTKPNKGGVQVVSSAQIFSALTQALAGVAGSLLQLTMNLPTAFFTDPILYLALTTAQGAAATADFYVTVQTLP